MENSINICDFPNEILLKILSKAKNDKKLMLISQRFYELITKINEDNIKLEITPDYLVRNFKILEDLHYK